MPTTSCARKAPRLCASPSTRATQRRLKRNTSLLNGGGLSANRPTIQLEPDGFALVAEEVESALIASGAPLFRRGNRLVIPIERDFEDARGERITAVQLDEIEVDYLRELMERAAAFQTYNVRAKGWRPVKPPVDIAKLIMARSARWRFPEPIGIITAPTLGPRGEFITRAGFDPATRLLLVNPPPMPPIPERPTAEDAVRALDELVHLIDEFPFVDELSRSVALAAVLTLIGRGAFPLAPMFACSAPTPATGKSFLWDVVSTIATGRSCPVLTPGKGTEEMEKRIGGVLLGALPLISLDNVNDPIASSLLCQALERPRVMVRLLGSSLLVEID